MVGQLPVSGTKGDKTGAMVSRCACVRKLTFAVLDPLPARFVVGSSTAAEALLAISSPLPNGFQALSTYWVFVRDIFLLYESPTKKPE